MTRRVMGGALPALIVGGVVAVAVLAGLAVAGRDLVGGDRQATTYLVSGRADIPAGQVHDGVVVARGVVTIDGTVEGDVVVGSGHVRLDGVVHGDVVVLRGGARLGPEAQVGGDVRTSQTPRIREGAAVEGDVVAISTFGIAGELPSTLWFALWLAAGLAVLVVGLAARGTAAEAARSGAGRPGRALVIGGAAVLLVPVAVGVLALSVLGLGLAAVLAGGLAVAAAVGAAAVAVAVGRLAGLREGPMALLAGWVALGAGLGLALAVDPLLALAGAVGVVALGVGALVPDRRSSTRSEGPDEDEVPHAGDPEDEELVPALDTLPPEPAEDEPQILAAFPIASGSRN